MLELSRLGLSLAAGLLVVAPAQASMTLEQAYAHVERLCPVEASPALIDALCQTEKQRRLGACYGAIQNTTQVNRPIEVDTGYAVATAEQLFRQEPFTPLAPGLAGFAGGLQRGLALDAIGGVLPLAEPHTLGLSLLPKLSYEKDLKLLTIGIGAFVNPSPTLNPLLESQLIADGRVDLARSMEDDASPLDDVVYEIRVAVNGPFFGQDFAWHADELSTLTEKALPPDALAQWLRLADVRAALNRESLDQPRARSALACLLQAGSDARLAMNLALKEARLSQFGVLVRNQPRLEFTHRRLRRDDALGADSNSWRASLNSGVYNVDFLRLSGACGAGLDRDACPAHYKGMLDSFLVRHGLSFGAYYEWGDVLDVSIDYQAAAAALPLPLPPSLDREFVLEGGKYRRLGLGSGLVVTLPEEGSSASSRLDLVYEYTDYRNLGARVDHSILRLTWTLRRGDLALPIHLAYQTKTEFSADALDPLTAALGVQYSAW